MNSMTVLLLGLLTVTLTSAQTGMRCYSCDLNKHSQCANAPMALDKENNYVQCPAGSQCYFTYYSGAGTLFGKRGCTNMMDPIPSGLDKFQNGCFMSSGLLYCHFTCNGTYCNTHVPQPVTVAAHAAPALQLSALMTMMVMTMMMIL